MQRLFEFTQHHPILIGLAVALLAALAADEVMRRLRKFRELGPAEGVLFMNKGAAVLDLRTQAEFSAGHIIRARNIPLPELDARAGELEKHREEPLLLCCKDGSESPRAAGRLIKRGFKQLAVLKGGIAAWQQQQFPLERG